MKYLSLILFAALTIQLEAQTVSIPDANFKAYLLNHPGINTNGDGEIQVVEASAFTDSIICPNQGIFSISGISAFTNLTFLNVALNNISSINVYQNTQLKSLIFPFNEVSVISLGTNSNLEELVCWENNLTEIDVSFNPGLKRLEFPNNNVIDLDLSQNPLIERLIYSGNSVGYVDFGNLTQLKYLECNGTSLPSLDVSNCPLLEYVQCMVNTVPYFDFSQNPLLQTAKCDFNIMTELDLSLNPNLLSVGVFGCNNLTTLNLQNGANTSLTNFQANNAPNLSCVLVDDVAYSVSNWTQIDTSSLFKLSCDASVKELSTVSVSTYPNPFLSEFTVESEHPIEGIVLYSTDGKAVLDQSFDKSTKAVKIDGSALADGVYTIHVIHAGGERIGVSRIIK